MPPAKAREAVHVQRVMDRTARGRARAGTGRTVVVVLRPQVREKARATRVAVSGFVSEQLEVIPMGLLIGVRTRCATICPMFALPGRYSNRPPPYYVVL